MQSFTFQYDLPRNIVSDEKKSVGAQLRRLSEHEITEPKGVPLPTGLGIGVTERADLAPAAVMGFNGIICAHVLPAAG